MIQHARHSEVDGAVVERVAPDARGGATAAGLVVGFEHPHLHALRAQQLCGSQARHAGADDGHSIPTGHEELLLDDTTSLNWPSDGCTAEMVRIHEPTMCGSPATRAGAASAPTVATAANAVLVDARRSIWCLLPRSGVAIAAARLGCRRPASEVIQRADGAQNRAWCMASWPPRFETAEATLRKVKRLLAFASVAKVMVGRLG